MRPSSPDGRRRDNCFRNGCGYRLLIDSKRLTECEGVESVLSHDVQDLKMRFEHFGGHQVNRSCNRLLAIPVIAAGDGAAFKGGLHVLLGFVGNQNAASRPGHANHLANGLGAVVEEVDSPYMEDHIETGIGKGQRFRVAEKEIGRELPAA